MYEYIQGEYKGLNKDYVIVENNGIGYKIFTSGNSICSMPLINDNVKLYVEQIVREDFIGLYGFLDKEELDMFLKLININGIGTKAALSLLSVNTVDSLKKAIHYSDEKTIIKANGIGKKNAQRIILELKDKIKFTDSQVVESINQNIDNLKLLEVTQALLSLGFVQNDIDNILPNIMISFPDESLEFIIKECLKNLTR